MNDSEVAVQVAVTERAGEVAEASLAEQSVDENGENGENLGEVITPEVATEMLGDIYPHQRSLRPRWVESLATEMREGHWRLTSDAICIINGQLANGQHRLEAVRKAGIPCKFIVLRSSDEELYKVLDCGKARSIADVLGKMDDINAKDLASSGRMLCEYDRKVLDGVTFGPRNDLGPTRNQVLDYIGANIGLLREAQAIVAPLRSKSPLLSPKIALAFTALALRKPEDRDRLLEFLDAAFCGRGSGKSEPVDVLYRRLLKNSHAKSGRLYPYYVFAIVIKAWAATLECKKVKHLKMGPSEPFPAMP